MQKILQDLDSLDFQGDAKLQVILFVICPPSKYSVLLNHISLPVIFVGISLEIFDEKVFCIFMISNYCAFRALKHVKIFCQKSRGIDILNLFIINLISVIILVLVLHMHCHF